MAGGGHPPGKWDKSLADLDNLPDPDELALEIVENLEAGLESFKAVIAALNTKQN